MFKKITDLTYKKSKKEALGFYLAFALFGILGAAISGGLSSIIFGAENFSKGFDVGVKVGAIFAVIYSMVISSLVLFKRHFQNKFVYILLTILSGLFAIFGGVLLGMLVPAFLLTRDD